jgi:hypothetical protein
MKNVVKKPNTVLPNVTSKIQTKSIWPMVCAQNNCFCHKRLKWILPKVTSKIWTNSNQLIVWALNNCISLLWKWKKIVYLKAYLGEIWAKLAIFYEILNLKLVILTNFWRKFAFLWPFLKLLMAKIGLFIFFGHGNSVWWHWHGPLPPTHISML